MKERAYNPWLMMANHEIKTLKINDGSALRNRIRLIVYGSLTVAILTGGAVALRECHKNMKQVGIVRN